ncbi:glycosyltransferase family 39 protein [Phycisphaeraceae bacterium D3-23]
MFANKRLWAIILCAIFALALGLRLGLAAAFVGLDAPPDAQANPDQLDFEAIAWQVAQGNGFVLDNGEPTARRAAGAVGTMAVPYALTGRSYAAGRVWLAALSSATCLLCVWIGCIGFGRGVGVIAGLALALYPGHMYYAMHFVSETPFAFWLALGAALSLHGLRHEWRWRHMLAGAVWACAILTKPQFVLMVPLVLGILALIKIVALCRNTSPRGATASPTTARSNPAHFGYAPALITCLAVAACVAPWIARNHAVMHTPGLSTIVGHTLWGSNNEVVLNDPEWRGLWVRTSDLELTLNQPLPEGEAAANDAATGYAIAFARSHLRDLPGMALSKLRRLITPWPATTNRAVRWAEGLAWMIAAPLLLLGSVRWWRRHRAAAYVLVTPIAVTLAVSVVFYGSVRFRNALAPVLIVFAAAGFDWLLSRIRGHYRSRSVAPLRSAPVTC